MRLHRRLFALLTAALFTLSIVGHGFMLGGMGAKIMTATGAEMASQAAAMDCDKSPACDDTNGMHLVCVAHCASLVAVLSDPAPLPAIATVREVLSLALTVPAGRNSPPDPYPPKPLVLI